MDSTKVGSGVPTAINNQSAIKKNSKLQSSRETSSLKKPEDNSDFSVAVSDKARELAEGHAKALEIARKTSDIRETRVAELKRKIDDGEYHVDSGKIADGILREAIRDELSRNNV